MGWWSRLTRFFRPRNETVDMTNPLLLQWLGVDPDTPRNQLSEATYFACLKILSESLGKLPLKMYQKTERGIVKSDREELYNLLKLRPNPYMTSSVFWSTVEMNRNHYGNAYVWCQYSGPQLQALWILPSQYVTIVVDDRGLLGEKNAIWYRYNDPYDGKMYVFRNDEILHFKTSVTFDGITGLSVRDVLKHTVDGALESQKFMNNLYKTGLTGKAVLEYTGDLNQEARDRLVKGFEQFANGSKNAGKIIPVPLGMKLVPLDIKLTDSQFFELKKYTALQIAAAFGIKPNQINDYEKSSYASAEAQNLAFYVDTLLYVLKQYEEEITYKILSNDLISQGHYFKFNVNVILRADIKTQMDSLSTAVQNGIMTPNEARDYLDMPADDYGNNLMANGNYIPLSMLGANYGKGGDS
ncbi:putative portal protein [Geobacillus virus E2]|uniref:portal protein n=1 Tax=Geobacillus virus E2 TaxID=447909 RepID=UPI00015367D8|nr:portal protein [Geobacillus virus E2]ABI36821.1 putative portal protein [Geobacillus virus E2]